ncbi:hypothetical protein PM025_14750 [Halorubrum ezzemoulense]|uniref:hypothetical protein n=1 Tax=Halorubrum ezzemoulense TaxID=337243 RepID=UPI002330B9E3|nr:hypothetical protein [Halorubrum ezzemoulense]MDB2265376.1 hypothetical protein [Halorubrum ezzemoulense]
MVGSSIESGEIEQLYADLAEDVSTREKQLRKNFQLNRPQRSIRTYVGSSTTGRADESPSGAVSVCEVYTQELGKPLEGSLKQLLTGLDASINVLDDIIDTQELTPQTRISLTVNAAFSAVLLAENCPPETRDEVGNQLRGYFTALFQIPLVEQRLFALMENAETKDQRQQVAEQIDAYRSRDIDAFADIAAVITDLDTETKSRVRHDLQAYRARRLLFKDISDVERDLRDDDMTPVIQLLQHHETTDELVAAVMDLYHRFSYSETGHERYGDRLYELEGKPDELESLLIEAEERVNAAGGVR